MTHFSAYVAIISFITLVVAFFNRNTFDSGMTVMPTVLEEPSQSPTNATHFSATIEDEPFEIMPKYDYEISGLVVSYRLHDADAGQMIHALNKDHLNVADYCVVWGDSANPAILNEFDFSNGQFTCNYSTNNRQAWQQFNNAQLSNNHLLAVEEHIRDTIDEIEIGDQINIKGWLAHYKNPLGFERGTSVVRTDTGNGACETIFVNDIQIIKHMNGFWRTLMSFSLGTLIISLFFYIKSPFQPRHT